MTVSDETPPSTLDIQRILEVLPHRYPFLMVDRMEDVVRGESAVGIKNVSVNEPYFQGHFPGSPVMPGVLVIEAMAQTAGILVIETLGPEMEGKLVYFMSIENARFRKPVRPGDRMRIQVVKRHARKLVWKFDGVCRVDGEVVAEATYTAMIVDKVS
ncbi:MAG: 3-hydroxyacyl-ACP dehydratase FabZ [Rhodospirillaceae bacterium]|nr:3-hydroxyacyl-ACP dehydratase FabZ [Rhodospirillaceae bacterium]MDE0618856.1 3-hydroxyacyl-ACP dehydratase FabZ [Rhodospirillaceae bacterium]MXY41962.1 3-hydroxyacyl-ACP dehydratase FabZ [Rhodospirillaceae bacterium]MYH36388.1 3-hydroxyacyl-ACP dehydratase FabZ [Rhodospirillaceae bacterium]MYK15065.1 3-hydroxyacyl-ACP dehydratase FabZ [Rhodospirillaceae bacterium]